MHSIYIRVYTGMSHIYEKRVCIKRDGTICTRILCKFNYSCTATTKGETNNHLNVTEDSMQ